MTTSEQAAEIGYRPSTVGLDTHRYDLRHRDGFLGDAVAGASLDDLAALATSPHWQDRVRAEVLRERTEITMPDQFPCIFETSDSPHRAGYLNPRPFPWVVSPDLEMLTRLLPDYQELWDSYTSQWGAKSRRTMAVGLLDNLPVYGVYRPGTSPEEVIGSTMLTHTDMYRRAPERLRRMHPLHEHWKAAK